jgi:hypothetical protein
MKGIISFKNKIYLLIGNILLSRYFVIFFYFFFNKKFINYYNFKILTQGVDKKNCIRLLFSIYEKSEIYLINKHFDDVDTVELGSGIGCISGALRIKYKKSDFKQIMVEANSANILLAKKNFNFNRVYKKNIFFLNKIFISNDNNRFLEFKKNKVDFLHGKLYENSKARLNSNNIITIDKITKKFKLKTFNAIIDIEGEEFNFSYKTFSYLKKCQKLVIEIHSQNSNLVKKLLNKFYKISNLKMKDRSGFVYYLENINE